VSEFKTQRQVTASYSPGADGKTTVITVSNEKKNKFSLGVFDGDQLRLLAGIFGINGQQAGPWRANRGFKYRDRYPDLRLMS
jgi:hypothetical protein